MAIENIVPTGPVGLKANADLSSLQHRFVKMTTTPYAVDVCGAAGEPIGVLLNKPTSGVAASIAGVGSVVKVTASAAITAADKIGVAANGKARTAADNDYIAGIALDTVANDGELVSVYLTPIAMGIDDDT